MTGDDNAGVTVTFSLSVNNSGATLSSASAVTDGAGNAVVTYTAGANNPTLTAYDTVRAAVGSITSTAVITRTGTEPAAYTLTLTADPSSVTVPNGGGPFDTVLTVTVKDQNGDPTSGVSVDITPAGGGATVNVVTGADGKGIVMYNVIAARSGAIVFMAQAPVLNISASTSVTVTEMPAP